jgi:uncharacterized protein YwqG
MADFSTLNEEQLVAAYIENVRFYKTIEHVGHMNRVMGERMRIVDELEARGAGTAKALLGLLDHTDLNVRLSAAIHCRAFDRAAYEETVRTLAERRDEIGQDARHSLEMDAFLRKHGYPDRHKKPSLERGPYAWMVEWQADNPPPDAMPYAEIARLLTNVFPGPVADRLLNLARPAIGLWPQRPRPDFSVTASRWGGMPHAPPNWSWPVHETEPMFFLGQINLADLAGLPGYKNLPPSGLLVFFGDHDAVNGCTSEGSAAVYHWVELDNLAPAVPPVDVLKVLPLCALAVRSIVDLPHPESRVVAQVLPEREQVKAYYGVWMSMVGHGIPEKLRGYCGFSKLLGWPSLVQGDFDLNGNPTDPHFLRLLLEIDKYSNGTDGEGWGPGGSLYFMINDRDLRARQFDRCVFEMQCT